MVRLLTDADVERLVSPDVALAAARRALADADRGLLAAPPWVRVDAGEQTFVLTAGGYARGSVGFRAYGRWPGASDQALLVWGTTARWGVVVGSELGARRTGALGGVAVDVMARADARRLAVVGSGVQAWAQVWAIAGVRPLERVEVFSPTRDHCERTHVTTVGPKAQSGHETPPGLADAAALVASDAPDQAAAYSEPFFTARPLTHLGRLVAEPADAARGEGDITLHCSTGLGGSEVVLAAALLERS